MEEKRLIVPFVDALEEMSPAGFSSAMDELAEHAATDSVYWPETFPHNPECLISVAHSRSHLAVRFTVNGPFLRGTVTEDGKYVHRDSCCECFLLAADGKRYANFEMNCIGTL